MMKLSDRELILAWLTLFIVLFALTYIVGKPYIETWKDLRVQKGTLEQSILKDERFLTRKAGWEERLDLVRKTITPLPEGRAAGNYLKKAIGDFASGINGKPKHELTLRDRKAGEEAIRGELFMTEVTCTWSGNTRGLVQLLIDFLEHDVMFDTTELLIRSSGKDRLRGTFAVNCVYTKTGAEE